MTKTDDPKNLTNERRKTHGDWTEQALVASQLKSTMRLSRNWSGLPAIKKEALDMIQTKISRILTGDFNEPDHWDDTAGYAFLGKGGHDVSTK